MTPRAVSSTFHSTTEQEVQGSSRDELEWMEISLWSKSDAVCVWEFVRRFPSTVLSSSHCKQAFVESALIVLMM